MEKIIGAHDTLTGYPAKGFISWLFKPMTKCQTKTLDELAEAGVTCYDIRMWMSKDGKWHYGHGISEYDIICNPDMLLQYIQLLHNTKVAQRTSVHWPSVGLRPDVRNRYTPI